MSEITMWINAEDIDRLADLDAHADRLADLAELRQLDYQLASAELEQARAIFAQAEQDLADANRVELAARNRVVAERRRLGVMRSADGSYRTIESVRAAERAGHPVADTAPKNSWQLAEAQRLAKLADPNRIDWTGDGDNS